MAPRPKMTGGRWLRSSRGAKLAERNGGRDDTVWEGKKKPVASTVVHEGMAWSKEDIDETDWMGVPDDEKSRPAADGGSIWASPLAQN
ncbi:hypothetical protein E2562_004049 [Oryza meyeriana var. granulata]|uniref:Uncharacterized protein n=1 Tax=Oryza meyeriana var. granulata TaxID=110450 RepID=A0A6G1BJF7_9ORYZ|nr:hypothetical protein E2562_004049 [Oryza meyeriana var. granulata]